MSETGSLSVIVPAFNEEQNIVGTIEVIERATKDVVADYEILVINDCSTDQTRLLAEQASRTFKNVRVVNNEVNLGFGGSYRKGLSLAEKDYVVMVPGDNEIAESSIVNIIGCMGKADIVVPYSVPETKRPLVRRILSSVYTEGLNFLFGLNLKYYNGICLMPRKTILKAKIDSDGFAYMAQALIRLIKIYGHSYTEVEMRVIPRKVGRTKAFALKNIYSVISTIVLLWFEIHLQPLQKRFAAKTGP